MADRGRQDERSRRRAPRRLTPKSLENAALFYLERFATSSANLRRVLLRKVARAAAATEDFDREAAMRWVDELIARHLAAGLLDDEAYAAQKAASLRRRGTSRRGIAGRLAQRGVPRDLIEGALGNAEEDGGGDLAAACALIRRRRLGPYRAAAAREAAQRRDFATLARAGFGFDIARRALAAANPEALERLAGGAEE